MANRRAVPWRFFISRKKEKENPMFILGKKLNMSQIWKEGKVIPVTLVEVSKNKVTIVRTKEKDGYEAVQLANGKKKREFRFRDKRQETRDKEIYKVGDTVDVSVFKEGDVIRVSGVSKGRGFQGVVKRHGFGGGPKSHGQKNRLRAPGSIGSTAPQRGFPGLRMAGRMGGEKKTVKNLEIIEVEKGGNLIAIKGA